MHIKTEKRKYKIIRKTLYFNYTVENKYCEFTVKMYSGEYGPGMFDSLK